MRLLAINSYDKDACVDRWAAQVRLLDPVRWRAVLVTNGPSGRDWSGVGLPTVRCANPTEVVGYRFALAATPVARDVDAVVSVHAKSWVPDLALLDLVADRALGPDAEAALLQDWGLFDRDGGGECLFLMGFRRDAWVRAVARLRAHPIDSWNEVGLHRAVRACGIRVHRLPVGRTLTTGDQRSHLVMGIERPGLDLYGCEPGGLDLSFDHFRQRVPWGVRGLGGPDGVVARDP